MALPSQKSSEGLCIFLTWVSTQIKRKAGKGVTHLTTKGGPMLYLFYMDLQEFANSITSNMPEIELHTYLYGTKLRKQMAVNGNHENQFVNNDLGYSHKIVLDNHSKGKL